MGSLVASGGAMGTKSAGFRMGAGAYHSGRPLAEGGGRSAIKAAEARTEDA